MLYGYRKYMTAGIVMIEATVVMIMPAEIMSSSAPNCLASINGMFPAGIATNKPGGNTGRGNPGVWR